MRLIFYLILFSSFLGGHTNSIAQASRERIFIPLQTRLSDSLELIYLYQQTRGELWKVQWDFKRPLDEWYGVRLNDFGRVTCIDLDGIPDCGPSKNGGNHLHGVLPDLDLPYLEHLFLSSNKIGDELPDFHGSPFLLTLQLSGNVFEGTIPAFSHLQKLVKLDLEFNQLSGAVPSFELPKLETLYLGHNMLSGALPAFPKAKNLKHLYVNDNLLAGQLPMLSPRSKMQLLILCNNYFEGTLPEYFRLKNLRLLDVSQNLLEGCFKEKEYIGLTIFNAEGNQLEACLVTDIIIPTAFSPNGDGINDRFEIEGFDSLKSNGGQIEFTVVNLNHQIVYSNKDYQGGWSGISDQGKILQEGLYIYYLSAGTHQFKRTVFIKK